MEQENSKQPNQPKKVVKKVVKKTTSKLNENNQSTAQNGQPTKKIVKKVVKKVVRKPAQGEQTPQNSDGPKKINYKEEIEKLAPTTKNDNVDRSIHQVNIQPKNIPNENTVIKSATGQGSKQEQQKNESKTEKRILKKRSRLSRLFRKYGVLLILFFVFSAIYLSWMYLVPAILNFKITTTDINDFLQPKIGFKVDYSNSYYYTTPQLAIGVRYKNFKLIYPEGRLDEERMQFLKARSAVFEVPVIPLLMKTIKFNEFSLRSVTANLYQDKNGKYVYLEQFKNYFNPNAPKYLLEVPDIMILSYNMPSFNEQTKTFTKKRGAQMKIPAKTVREAIKSAPKSNTIMIR